MRIAFELGVAEKHQVQFAWEQFFGSSRIAVDGTVVLRGHPVALDELKIISNRYRYLYDVVAKREVPWERIRNWEIEVGDVEKHYVRIEKERPQFLAGLRPHTYRVFVDGDLLLERSGY